MRGTAAGQTIECQVKEMFHVKHAAPSLRPRKVNHPSAPKPRTSPTISGIALRIPARANTLETSCAGESATTRTASTAERTNVSRETVTRPVLKIPPTTRAHCSSSRPRRSKFSSNS